ncbi:unnamed protein product [Lepidochelys kempii]
MEKKECSQPKLGKQIHAPKPNLCNYQQTGNQAVSTLWLQDMLSEEHMESRSCGKGGGNLRRVRHATPEDPAEMCRDRHIYQRTMTDQPCQMTGPWRILWRVGLQQENG